MSDGKSFPPGNALVIGGSGGVGGEICRALAQAGADVALSYHKNHTRAQEVAQEVKKAGRKASIHALNLHDDENVRQVIDEVASAGRLHTVVIASGSDIEQLFIRDLPPPRWKEVIDADLHGFFRVVHAALPHLKKDGGGSFVHISSAGLHRWPPRDVLSVAPKAAIESLILGIAKEEGRYGVRANSVALGVVETGIFLRLLKDGTFNEKWIKMVQDGLCLKRWGKPEEVAAAVVYLASNQAGYVTGQMISVDGGYGV